MSGSQHTRLTKENEKMANDALAVRSRGLTIEIELRV